MASEHDSRVQVTSFSIIIFAPLAVVWLLVTLAICLTILDFWSWLSYTVHENRARRDSDATLVQDMEDGIVENSRARRDSDATLVPDMENGILENSLRSDEGAGNDTDQLLGPANRSIEERVWWRLDFQPRAGLGNSASSSAAERTREAGR